MKQQADQTQSVDDEFVKRRMQLRIAPGPSGNDVPEWTTDGDV